MCTHSVRRTVRLYTCDGRCVNRFLDRFFDLELEQEREGVPKLKLLSEVKEPSREQARDAIRELRSSLARGERVEMEGIVQEGEVGGGGRGAGGEGAGQGEGEEGGEGGEYVYDVYEPIGGYVPPSDRGGDVDGGSWGIKERGREGGLKLPIYAHHLVFDSEDEELYLGGGGRARREGGLVSDDDEDSNREQVLSPDLCGTDLMSVRVV